MKGIVAGLGIIFAAIWIVISNMDPYMFYHVPSLVLVVGGSAGIFLYCTPAASVVPVIKMIANLMRPELLSKDVNLQLLELNKNASAKLDRPHPLIAYAQELWEKGVEPDMFQALLLRHAQELNGTYIKVIVTLRNFAKYPPALGMTGTVLGLVDLFAHLSNTNKSSLGPSLALAMITTLYGLIISNVVIMPLADRLQVIQMSESGLTQHICKILLMIEQDHGESVIKDEIHVAA